MNALVPIFVFLFATPKTATVGKNETLTQLAARSLGDEDAAPEIAALNGIASDSRPKAGTKLKLPGPGRESALERMHRTQAAMRNANSEDGRKAAQVQLDRAYDALHLARYAEAEALAVSAEGELAHPTTRVSVIVEPNGKETRFLVESGTIEVTSGGSSAVATAGTSVRAGAGAAPRLLRDPSPAMPALVEPADGAQVEAAALRWNAETAGLRYHVEVARDPAFQRRVFSADVDAASVTAPLDEGTWFWRVHAIDAQGSEGIPTLARSFVLKRPPRPAVNVGKPVFGQ